MFWSSYITAENYPVCLRDKECLYWAGRFRLHLLIRRDHSVRFTVNLLKALRYTVGSSWTDRSDHKGKNTDPKSNLALGRGGGGGGGGRLQHAAGPPAITAPS